MGTSLRMPHGALCMAGGEQFMTHGSQCFGSAQCSDCLFYTFRLRRIETRLISNSHLPPLLLLIPLPNYSPRRRIPTTDYRPLTPTIISETPTLCPTPKMSSPESSSLKIGRLPPTAEVASVNLTGKK